VREVVDLVDSVASTWTRTIRIVVFGAIAVAAIVMLMIAVTAPAVVDNVGDRAERISEKAIETARQEARAQAMAEEGWGYSDANAGAAADSEAAGFSEDTGTYSGDDWGAPAE
jgi:hypothetical protein